MLYVTSSFAKKKIEFYCFILGFNAFCIRKHLENQLNFEFIKLSDKCLCYCWYTICVYKISHFIAPKTANRN